MIPNPYLGTFVAMEGIDGCGKSLHVERLAKWLREERSIAVNVTKEPNKTSLFGRKIYEDLANPSGLHQTQPARFQRWYACDSRTNVKNEVVPHLSSPEGRVVITDRYRPSMVYGATHARDLPKLMTITESIMGEYFFWPDQTFILDVSVKQAIERLKSKGRVLDGHENEAKLAQVRKLYLDFARAYPDCYVISSDGDIDGIAKIIQERMTEVLKKKGR